MPHNSIKCDTFSNRAFGCPHYAEEDNYAKVVNALFKKVINHYKDDRDDTDTADIANSYQHEYKRKSFTGLSYLYTKDRSRFETYCNGCVENLGAFLSTYNVSNILDSYRYNRVVGQVGCLSEINNKKYVTQFVFRTTEDTFDRLFYYRFNSYMYNKCNGLAHDALIFVVPENSHYLIKYNENDYTIRHGFIGSNIKKNAHNPGHLCLTCKVKHCAPRLITNLGRLL
ncbi:MAG: hypothetical protein GY861_26960 [bacterium]|nr:hypothetical protein [bacterium]